MHGKLRGTHNNSKSGPHMQIKTRSNGQDEGSGMNQTGSGEPVWFNPSIYSKRPVQASFVPFFSLSNSQTLSSLSKTLTWPETGEDGGGRRRKMKIPMNLHLLRRSDATFSKSFIQKYSSSSPAYGSTVIFMKLR